MKSRHLIVGIGIAVVAVFAMTALAVAWPEPEAEARGAACVGGTRATAAEFEVFNRETDHPGSPGHVGQAAVVAAPALALPQPVFSPASIPNTGDSSATVSYDIPALYEGTLKLTYRMFWDGTEGSDVRPALSADPAQVTLHVVKCEEPETTTTTEPETTTTTEPETTTTTEPETTTTTEPETTTTTEPTTTTTEPTTTTTEPTTTTTKPTTTTTQPTTTTAKPTTTTVKPCEEPADTVPGSPNVCVLPPVVIERPAPAAPVPASPVFTG